MQQMDNLETRPGSTGPQTPAPFASGASGGGSAAVGLRVSSASALKRIELHAEIVTAIAVLCGLVALLSR